MNLDDQLRAVLGEVAEMRTATPPDVQGLISGGRARGRRRHVMWGGGSVLAAVIAVGGVYGVAQLGNDDVGSGPLVTNQPTAESLPASDEPVPIDSGTYVVPRGYGEVAPYTITLPPGWEVQHGDSFSRNADQPGAITIGTFALDGIRLTDDACTGREDLGAAQTSTASLVAGLRAQGSGPRVGDPVAATVGGLPATRIDLDYPGSQALSNCRLSEDDPHVGPGVLQVWSGYFVLFPHESASVYVVEVGDRAQVFATRIHDDASAADRAELESILGSIDFQTGAE